MHMCIKLRQRQTLHPCTTQYYNRAGFERGSATHAQVLVHLKFKVHSARVGSFHMTLLASKVKSYLFTCLFIHLSFVYKR